jgi:hypothetical protein
MSAAKAELPKAIKATLLSRSFFITIPHSRGATFPNKLASIWLLCGDAAGVMSHM